MAYEKSPAEEHPRKEPLVLLTDDNTRLELFVESGGVSASGPAVIRNARWLIRVKGVEYDGCEASVYETNGQVLEQARDWWSRKREESGNETQSR